MSLAELTRLLDRWAADAAFRAALRRDPEAAISRAGYELDEVEWAAVHDTDWTRPDAELRTRLAHVSASPPA